LYFDPIPLLLFFKPKVGNLGGLSILEHAEPLRCKMNSLSSTSGFVEKWLGKLTEKLPSYQTVAAISDATRSEQLDEAQLLKRLRELSKPPEKEESQ
jgi:hypothetical protein